MAPNNIDFDLNKIKSDVPKNHIGDDSRVISVAYLQSRENRNDLEDTVLALKVLNCTVGGNILKQELPQTHPKHTRNRKFSPQLNPTTDTFFALT
jgi:hypothetical protein